MSRAAAIDAPRPRRVVALGIVLLIGVDLLDAAKEVVSGRLVRELDDLTLTFLLFVVAAAVFTALHLGSRARTLQAPLGASSRRDLIWLNVATAACWIGFFRSLRFVEPAIVSAIIAAVGPVSTFVLDRWLRPGGARHWVDALTALGLAGTGAALGAVSLTGGSALGDRVTVLMTVDGLVSATVCGVAVALTTVLLKRLTDARIGTRRVLAHRFHLLLVVTGLGALWAGNPLAVFAEHAIPIVAIALTGIVATLFLLQEGIRRCEPMTVEAMLAVAPVFTLGLQLFDDELTVSPWSWVGVAVLCGFAYLNGYHHLKESQP